MVSLDTAMLRRIAAAPGDEYTLEARDAAREVLGTRTQHDQVDDDAADVPGWLDSVPRRVRGMLPMCTFVASVATLLLVAAPFIARHAGVEGSALLLVMVQLCLIATIASAMRISVCAVYWGLAATAAGTAAMDGTWELAVVAMVLLWWRVSLYRDPEVSEYYKRIRHASRAAAR